MDMNAQLAYISSMWGDSPRQSVPPLLAHYTSLSTIEKILNARQFWLSNPLYMNDLEELRFGMHVGAMVFRASDALRLACRTEDRHERLLSYFDALFSEYDRTQALDAYVLCLSEHDASNTDGVLAMWRGYGAHGTGAALLLNLEALPPFEESALLVGKVAYASQGQRQSWMETRVSALAAEIDRHEKTDLNLESAARTWFERLKVFAIFSKHPGFTEEREWRIVYMRERDQQDRLSDSLGYLVSDRGVEPKLKLQFSRLSQSAASGQDDSSLLAGLILGPSQSGLLAQASIRRMVTVLGHDRLAPNLWASSIPFRNR